jgi:hypothetical protein
MTIWEYAIARTAGTLMAASAERELQPKECAMLEFLAPVLLRLEQDEEDRRLAPPPPPKTRGRVWQGR